MKLPYLLAILFVLMAITEKQVDAKNKDKKKKKSKSKLKVKIDDDYDRNHVGCEPWKFTIYTYEDSWCQYKTGVRALS